MVTEPQRQPPARPPQPKRGAAARPAAPALPLHVRALAALRALPDHRWLDRLVRGRLWIPLLGVLLTGIVAIQVEVLKLGASIGRSVALSTQLESRNQLLRASVARLSDDHQIMKEAVKLGMIMPGPTEQVFVPAHGRGALGKAIAGITAPNAQGFLTALTQQESTDGVTNPVLGTTSPAATGTTALGPGTGAVPTTGSSASSGAAAAGGTTAPTTGTTAPTTGTTAPASGTVAPTAGLTSGAATVTPAAPAAPTAAPAPSGTGQTAGGATGASSGTGGVAG